MSAIAKIIFLQKAIYNQHYYQAITESGVSEAGLSKEKLDSIKRTISTPARNNFIKCLQAIYNSADSASVSFEVSIDGRSTIINIEKTALPFDFIKAIPGLTARPKELLPKINALMAKIKPTDLDFTEMQKLHYPDSAESICKFLGDAYTSLDSPVTLGNALAGQDRISILVPIKLSSDFLRTLKDNGYMIEKRTADGLHVSVYLKNYSPIMDDSELKAKLQEVVDAAAANPKQMNYRDKDGELVPKHIHLQMLVDEAPEALKSFGPMLHHYMRAYGSSTVVKKISTLISDQLVILNDRLKALNENPSELATCFKFALIETKFQPERVCAIGLEVIKDSSLDCILQEFRSRVGIPPMTRSEAFNRLYHATLFSTNTEVTMPGVAPTPVDATVLGPATASAGAGGATGCAPSLT